MRFIRDAEPIEEKPKELVQAPILSRSERRKLEEKRLFKELGIEDSDDEPKKTKKKKITVVRENHSSDEEIDREHDEDSEHNPDEEISATVRSIHLSESGKSL